MNPPCARCGKTVYPTEKISCLDKNWHKGCFHCEVCKMTLNMKNYKGYDKKPYCNAHYPKTSFTIVTDTPENLRLKQQSELQSQVRYKRDFEESKGRGFSIVTDTPELQRLRRTQEHISNAKYHEEFERTRGRGATHTLDEQHMARLHGDQVGGGYHGVQPQVVEMDRRSGGAAELKVWRTDPGSIFDFDPVEDNIQSRSLRRMTECVPQQPSAQSVCSSLGSELWADRSASVCSRSSSGVYQQQSHHPQQFQQGYGHMQAVRSVQSPPHAASMRVYRALYDYAAQDHDEVSFRDGDVIINAQPIDEGWMFGTVQRTGKSGMLPANYVECFN
ncbi:LIM zinc-binding domain-containing Nebulette-like isoform X3 [Megalobrama amblycephala]|uniref:LIM zinc-binding domain-containing Nebulette-like isoform X3 n=1 Tax=Megalobrama amblycephala TaxID=75352 RepID=UPI00201429A4|nr:LIM zinc-binding domain-containing Nebulette-like isoform X3 [Megalobrama amblycephala]